MVTSFLVLLAPLAASVFNAGLFSAEGGCCGPAYELLPSQNANQNASDLWILIFIDEVVRMADNVP